MMTNKKTHIEQRVWIRAGRLIIANWCGVMEVLLESQPYIRQSPSAKFETDQFCRKCKSLRDKYHDQPEVTPRWKQKRSDDM